jgi:hypothetical protein
VLDVRAGRSGGAALWPGVLRRMDLFHDLLMLDELERLCLSDAQVVGYTPGGGSAAQEALEVLAPEAAPRVAAAYGRALDDHALEQGWPRREAA